jgi:hypothetical protein
VAGHAANLKNGLGLGEGDGFAGVAVGGRNRQRRAGGVLDAIDQGQHHGRTCEGCRETAAPGREDESDVHPVAQQCAGCEHHQQDQPVQMMAIEPAVMIAQHGEDDREGEIVVVDGALFGPVGQAHVLGVAGLDGPHHFLLGGNDVEEHVARHEGAQQGAHQQIGRASAQLVTQHPGRENDQAQGHGILERGGQAGDAPQHVVGHPASSQHGDGQPAGVAEAEPVAGFIR